MEINIFISHSWKYSHHYNTLYDWIFRQQWKVEKEQLTFKNYSVPQDNPIHNASNDKELKIEIDKRMKSASVIVIPTGMYSSYSKWIEKEINIAKYYSKPILAVNPWGQEKKSSIVGNASSKLVGWNKNKVVEAIYNLHKEKVVV